jgi:hypothetical protein
MLANRRKVTLKNGAVISTPLLLPSFSSKALQNESVTEIIEYMSATITDEILVSAYDLLFHKLPSKKIKKFASAVFLDSGGYEGSKDADLSDTGEHQYIPGQWTQKHLDKALSEKWDFEIPTVLVTYDSPHSKTTIKNQIDRGKKHFLKWPRAARNILFKTESVKEPILNIKSIIDHKHELANFDVIGVTEKELGKSTLDRMVNIASIRLALQSIGLETPIHVFGSLDSISSPLYFLAGADIFDGLTWLRYAYSDGNTIYKHNYGATHLGISFDDYRVNGKIWSDNYFYLFKVREDMQKFLLKGDFGEFRYNGALFKKLFTEFEATMASRE